MQHPVKRIGRSEDIAHLIMFLCSDEAGFITGENICFDGGIRKMMIYHGENSWRYQEREYFLTTLHDYYLIAR